MRLDWVRENRLLAASFCWMTKFVSAAALIKSAAGRVPRVTRGLCSMPTLHKRLNGSREGFLEHGAGWLWQCEELVMQTVVRELRDLTDAAKGVLQLGTGRSLPASSGPMTRHAGLDSLCRLQSLFVLLLGLGSKSLSCVDAAHARPAGLCSNGGKHVATNIFTT